ncbi:acyl carrier protein [Streptomyces sp. NPDC005209]|uniref:acyl carrier protein n=1 Tax=Streptomyces sp. NPDC005209 TaxID=3156715 RepID=UPI0033BF6927
MASAPWNATFEAVLRRGLPGLAQDKTPAADEPLETYGLDSLALIGIVSGLEAAFDISLAGEVVVPVHSLTAGQLWGIVSAAIQPAWDTARSPNRRSQGPSPWAIA